MKLICSPISPYARKVMILARISGVTLDEIPPSKDGENGYKAGDNPLGKIPALEWQPGQFLFDSPVICEYIDSQREVPLLPAEGHARFLQLWQHALGDGLSDAVYNYRCETMRPEELYWDVLIKRHEASIRNSVATLDRICQWLGGPWTFGNLAIICALDYVEYRAGHIAWRDFAPNLAKWHEAFKADKAWQDTYAYEVDR